MYSISEILYPLYTSINIYKYILDVRQIPGTIIDNDFYHSWNSKLVELVTNIGYFRFYLASLVPSIMYLICLPIIYLGELQLNINSIPMEYYGTPEA